MHKSPPNGYQTLSASVTIKSHTSKMETLITKETNVCLLYPAQNPDPDCGPVPSDPVPGEDGSCQNTHTFVISSSFISDEHCLLIGLNCLAGVCCCNFLQLTDGKLTSTVMEGPEWVTMQTHCFALQGPKRLKLGQRHLWLERDCMYTC